MTPTPDAKLLEEARRIAPTIEKHSEPSERAGRLARASLDALREAGFTRLFLPRSLGGLEADPVTVASVSMEIARHDPAAAWAIMVSNQSAFAGGGLPDAAAEEVFGAGDLVAGIIAPPFDAAPVPGGYKLSGRRAFGSYSRDAKWLLTTGFAPKPNGPPDVFVAFVPASEIRVHETWGGALGMRATDSNDVELPGVFVPATRTFSLIEEPKLNKHYRGELYRFPTAAASVAAVIAPVSLGVAESAVREFRAIAPQKNAFGSQTKLLDRTDAQVKLGRAEGLVRSGRAYLLDALDRAWQRTRAGESLALEDKADCVLAGAHAAQSAAQAVDIVYSATGTAGIFGGRKLERVVRDSQVLRQHGFTAEGRYGTAAQMLMGLPPDLPILAG